MSRIDDWDGPDDTESFLRSCAFTHNIEQALRGKKGRAFFLELEAALLAMPEKRLAAGALTRPPKTIMVEGFEVLRFIPDWKERGEYCALGAVAVKRAMDSGKTKLQALKDLDQSDPYDDEDEGMGFDKIEGAADNLKISTPLAYGIVDANDERGRGDETPEERYERMLAWVRKQLANPGRFT